MYEFPHPRGRLTEKEALQAVRDLRLHPLHIRKLADARHIFSHVEWHMSGYMIRVDSLTRDSSDMLFVELQDARAHYPIPSAFAAYTDYLFSPHSKRRIRKQEAAGSGRYIRAVATQPSRTQRGSRCRGTGFT